VGAAYDRLVAEGYLTTRTGAGTFVSRLIPEQRRPTGGSSAVAGPLRPRALWADFPHPADLSATPTFDFRIGVPDTRLFPYSTWRSLLGRQFRATAVGTGMPCPPAGHSGLRASIARHLGVSRGVEVGPDEVLVTSGIQQGLDLVGRVLIEPGLCVAVEEPGYFSPRLVWASLGAQVATVPVDDEGLVVDALPSEARLVYVTPSHQMPTGVAMSLPRRMALLEWARAHNAAIVEDDYDSEFRFTTQALEPLHGLDRTGRVVYLGSFGKILLPTLRLGFVVAPPGLSEALSAAKFVADWHTSLPMQAALAEFIDDGGLSRHLRRVRHEYRQRHDRVVAALAGPLSAWLSPVRSVAGLHVSAYFSDTAADHRAFFARAQAAGIGLSRLSPYYANGSSRDGILLGYGGIPTDRVEEGLRRIQDCLAATRPHG
jgi:GntR family transcriptional regulator/MocR family aminotransferase